MNTQLKNTGWLLASCAALLVLSACGKRQAYEGMQASQRQECERAPTRSELERCLEHQQLGFEEYQNRRERDAETRRRDKALE